MNKVKLIITCTLVASTARVRTRKATGASAMCADCGVCVAPSLQQALF